MASKMLECADGAVCVTRFKNPPCPLEDRQRANPSDEKKEQTRTEFISSLQMNSAHSVRAMMLKVNGEREKMRQDAAWTSQRWDGCIGEAKVTGFLEPHIFHALIGPQDRYIRCSQY